MLVVIQALQYGCPTSIPRKYLNWTLCKVQGPGGSLVMMPPVITTSVPRHQLSGTCARLLIS